VLERAIRPAAINSIRRKRKRLRLRGDNHPLTASTGLTTHRERLVEGNDVHAGNHRVGTDAGADFQIKACPQRPQDFPNSCFVLAVKRMCMQGVEALDQCGRSRRFVHAGEAMIVPGAHCSLLRESECTTKERFC
jgi:hypothetical protein